MSTARAASFGHCTVVGGDKLPASTGGGAGVCTEVEAAIGKVAAKVRYSAEISVLSNSRLTVTLVVDGHVLPKQHFAIMDSELDAGAIRRFAASIARSVAGTAKTGK